MSQEMPVKLGQRGFHLFVNEFRGEPKVHIRKIYEEPVEGKAIVTKYGVTLTLDEWDDLKKYFHEADRQLLNQSKERNTRRAPTASGQVKMKQHRQTPYQRLPPANNNQQMNIDSARNYTEVQDSAPRTVEELFNGTLQNY